MLDGLVTEPQSLQTLPIEHFRSSLWGFQTNVDFIREEGVCGEVMCRRLEFERRRLLPHRPARISLREAVRSAIRKIPQHASSPTQVHKMPPRLQLLPGACKAIRPPTYQPLAPFLYPFLNQQRSASILSSLSDVKGAYNKRIRVGRGPSSGYGKTSGRGHKGQKQHGKVPVGFNGGQTPEHVVHGKRGFKNQYASPSQHYVH